MGTLGTKTSQWHSLQVAPPGHVPYLPYPRYATVLNTHLQCQLSRKDT